MTSFAWLIFVAAAALEVGGDAIIRKGLRGGGLAVVAAGLVTVALYGLVVNIVTWDFSKLLGVYVAFFALFSVLFGKFFFGESVPVSTWAGLTLIIIGGLVIQFGGRNS
jgi:drug/metabolite transporter superfamily protein YnfA